MPPESADVLYVADLAKKLGKTEAAIRQAVHRRDHWLPTPFRFGRRLAWRAADVDHFLLEQSTKSAGHVGQL